MMSRTLDLTLSRRAFLGSITLSVGGAAVAAQLPTCLLDAAPRGLTGPFHDPCADWRLDDICLAYPPYAFHVDRGVPHAHPQVAVALVDQMWVA